MAGKGASNACTMVGNGNKKSSYAALCRKRNSFGFQASYDCHVGDGKKKLPKVTKKGTNNIPASDNNKGKIGKRSRKKGSC